MNTRWRWQGWQLALVVALMLIAVLRLGHVVLHQPLAGYANQYDMVRTTDCLGLLPDADVPYAAATTAAPIERYRRGLTTGPGCLPSTEVAIAGLALGLDSVTDALGLTDAAVISLRQIAVLKALLLLLSLLGLQWALRRQPGIACAHAAVAALIIFDPFNTLYLASFYTEFAALWATWLALVLPLTWRQTTDAGLVRRAAGHGSIMLWALALALLTASRFQHVLLPTILLLWAIAQPPLQAGWRRRIIVWSVLATMPVLALQIGVQQGHAGIRTANVHNSLFGAALPAAQDAELLTARLGLPPRCAELVHTTWYLPRGRDLQRDCPEAMQLSRLRWSLTLLADPPALLRMTGRGVLLSGQWRPSYLGELAGQSHVALPSSGLGFSLASWVSGLPFWALLLFWATPIVVPLVLWVVGPPPRAGWLPQARVGIEVWLLSALGTIVALGWAVSIVGDGYSELARHLHLTANAACASCLLSAVVVAARLRGGVQRLSARRRLALALVGGSALFAGLWMDSDSVAFGVLDEPAAERGLESPLALAGWAIDPRGVRLVEAVLDDGRREAMTLQPYPVLAGIFGTGVGGQGVHYSGQIDISGAHRLEIWVTPQRGAATVVDRRWLIDARN